MNSIEQGPIVGKFGGTSMATAEIVCRVSEIVAKEDMRAVVVSAPGKMNSHDTKTTDLLSACNHLISEGAPFDDAFDRVASRFEGIGRGLNIHQSVVSWLSEIRNGIGSHNRDWILSRGEWLMAHIFAKFFGGAFTDAEKLIQLKNGGQIDPITYQVIGEQLQGSLVHVIPGFYGKNETGAIQIFPRGGSDITGAIVARGLSAREYQNWTDVDGVRAADPKVVPDAKFIPEITFREMRELSYRGAEVLQMYAVVPLAQVGIPIIIRNTFNPESSGTRIVSTRNSRNEHPVIGIAGKEGFISIQINKMDMNNQTGFASRVLDVFREHGVSVEHDPTGIDTMSVIVHRNELNGKTTAVLDDIKQVVDPDDVNVANIGLVCIVGQDIARNAGEIFTCFSTALSQEGINIKTVTFPTNGNSIIVGVTNDVLNNAVKAVYKACIQ